MDTGVRIGLPEGVLSGLAALHAVEATVDSASAQLYENYLKRKALPFAAGLAVEQLIDAVARASVLADEVDTSEPAASLPANGSDSLDGQAPHEAPSAPALGLWACEPEPAPLLIDAAARGALSTRAARASSSTSDSATTGPGPARMASVFTAGPHSDDPAGALASAEAEQGSDSVTQSPARPMSPTEADTLFLQRELAIPERPSSVADGSQRPAARDGPEHRLRRSVLARERASKERAETRRKSQLAEQAHEAQMIKLATGAVKGQKFTLHDDGTILPLAGATKRSRSARPGTGGGEVHPAVRLRDEGSLEVDDATQELLSQTQRGGRLTFQAGTGAQPAFGGRAARERKLADTLSRSRARAAAKADDPLAHPSAPSLTHDGLEDDDYFHRGVSEQPSIVDALGPDGVARGAVLREQGRGELAGGPHPKEAASGRGASGRSGRLAPPSSPRPIAAAGALPPSPSAVDAPQPVKRTLTVPTGRPTTKSGPLTPVSVHAAPQDSGFRSSPPSRSAHGAEHRGQAAPAGADAGALPAVREQRGTGGFTSAPPSGASALRAGSATRRHDEAPGGHPARHRKELGSASGRSPAARNPRERLPKQARPNPESHAAPPLWPGTSRFDPRGEAGPLGPAGVVEVHDMPSTSPSGAGRSLTTAGRTAGAREWGEAAARKTGGSLIVGGDSTSV